MSVTKTKSQNPIEYMCDVCGQNLTAIGKIPRCIGCGKRLCNICNKYMICPKDYNKLEIEDKKNVTRMEKRSDRSKKVKKAFTITPAIIFGIVGIFLLLITIIDMDQVASTIIRIVGGLFVLISILILWVFLTIEKRESTRYIRKIRDILIPYNIRRAPNSLIFVEKIHCSKCGEEIESTAEICEWCGSIVNKGEN